MITDKDITFICHVRIDNDKRIKNLRTIYKYYTQNMPNSKFVFVQDYEVGEVVANCITFNDNTTLIVDPTDGLVEKCKSYNTGAQLADTDILVFLDIDIIVDCNLLLECINAAKESNMLECLIGYNGVALYMTEAGEKKFLNTLNIEDLRSLTVNLDKVTNNANEFALVGNTRAVGGCLVMTKESFKRINGFNPFFKGWGYEDNEIISRAHRLGLKVSKSDDTQNVLFHLPHCDANTDKSKHSHYTQNEAIVKLVESLDKQQLETYIKQW